MKTLNALVAGVLFLFFAGASYAQEEPVKPAESESVQAAANATVAITAPAPAPKAPPVHRAKPVVSRGAIAEIQGEVVTLTGKSISVMFHHDADKGSEEEVMFTFDPARINVERIKSLGAISQGDTVIVRYVMETSDYGDIQKMVNKVVTIRFVKPANDQSFYKKRTSATTSSDDQLVSDTLSLKGEK